MLIIHVKYTSFKHDTWRPGPASSVKTYSNTIIFGKVGKDIFLIEKLLVFQFFLYGYCLSLYVYQGHTLRLRFIDFFLFVLMEVSLRP